MTKCKKEKVTKDGKKTCSLSSKEIDVLREKEKLADEYYDKLLRLQAEFENYKKRTAREKQEFVKYANEGLIAEILPVLDSLERALTGVNKDHDINSITEGVELIQKQLIQVIEKIGVKGVETQDKPFDPHQHEVVMQVASDDHDEGMIVEELQKGYTINEKLIRPAVVKVAGPKKDDVEKK